MKTLKMIHYRKEQEKKLKAINDYLNDERECDEISYEFINPYTDEISKENEVKYANSIFAWKLKCKSLDDRFVILTNPLPEESEKWFWLETEGEKRMYWLWELKFKAEQRLRYAKYGKMSILDYDKRGITINQRQDPTSATRYSVSGLGKFKKTRSVAISEAYGCLQGHLGKRQIFYVSFKERSGRVDYKRFWFYLRLNPRWLWRTIKMDIEWYIELKINNYLLAKYLRCPGFDIRHFEECAQSEGVDYYHGEMQNPYDFADPMGCLADYE